MSSTGSAPTLGNVVWGKVSSWPWWPGLVVPYERVLFFAKDVPKPVPRDGKVAVQFFSDGKIALLRPEQIVPFEENVHHLNYNGQHAEQIRDAYTAARSWIWVYGARGKLPYLFDYVSESALSEKSGVTEEVLDSDAQDKMRELRAELRALRAKRAMIAKEKEALEKEISDFQVRKQTSFSKDSYSTD